MKHQSLQLAVGPGSTLRAPLDSPIKATLITIETPTTSVEASVSLLDGDDPILHFTSLIPGSVVVLPLTHPVTVDGIEVFCSASSEGCTPHVNVLGT